LKALLLLLLALPAPLVRSQALPQTWKAVGTADWGGIDALNDSSLIKDEDAQDAANVITDNGYLEKRPGNVRIATILDGYAVKLVREWVAPSQTRYLIAHSSNTVYQSNLSASPVALSTVTNAQNVSIVSAFTKVYIADGGSALWYWDGSSTATVSGAPICNLIEFANERIYCGNIPAESSSRVRVSSFGGAGYWTVPSNVSTVGDAPNVFDFQKDDGESITCMKATPWGLFVGKRHSTHILKGYDNLTYYKRVIDPNVGCVDNRTVQIVNGQVIWLALDGVYSFNGTGQPVLISRSIEPLVKTIRQLNSVAAQWVTSTSTEFETGVITTNGPSQSWNAELVSGSIVPSSYTLPTGTTTQFATGTTNYVVITSTVAPDLIFDTFNDGNFSANPTWTVRLGGAEPRADEGLLRFNLNNGHLEANQIDTPVSTFTAVWNFAFAMGGSGSAFFRFYPFARYNGSKYTNGYMAEHNCDTSNSYSIYRADGSNVLISSSTTTDCTNGGTRAWQFRRDANGDMYFIVDHSTVAQGNDTTYSSGTVMAFASGGLNGGITATVDNIAKPIPYGQVFRLTSPEYDTGFSTPTWGFLQWSSSAPAQNVSPSTFSFETHVATCTPGCTFTAYQSPVQNQQLTSAQQRVFQYRASWNLDVSSTVLIGAFSFTNPQIPYLSSVTSMTVISTGVYYSPVHFVGTNISSWRQMNVTVIGDSAIDYYVRAASYTFVSTATVPAWTLQTNNTTISIATNTYVQFEINSTRVTASTQSEQIDRVALNWQEGTEVPMASGYLDRRYYLCVELSTTATTNDACLVFQKNGKWVKWTGPSIGAMGLYNTDLVMGSAGTDSYVWKVMQPGVLSDDGAAINSYWISKDFTDGIVFNNKVLHEFWIDAQSTAVSTMTASYAIDKTSTYTDSSVYIDSTLHANKRVPLNNGYDQSKYFRFKFGSNNADGYFRLNDYAGYIEDQPRTTE
jgi:hypothetical protein